MINTTITTKIYTSDDRSWVKLRQKLSLIPLQVLLWLDTNATQFEFSTSVEFMDVNELIGSMETEAVFRQLSKVVEKADLLRYEVVLSNFPPK